MIFVGSKLALGAPLWPFPFATKGVEVQPTMQNRAPNLTQRRELYVEMSVVMHLMIIMLQVALMMSIVLVVPKTLSEALRFAYLNPNLPEPPGQQQPQRELQPG